MKKIDDGHWKYRGCDVYLAEHPQLYGKYEVWKDFEFVERGKTLKEAKQIIINKFGAISKKKLKGTFL